MQMSDFADNIMRHKYSHTLNDGTKETWDNIAYRVTKQVMRSVGYTMRDKVCHEIHRAIRERKFIPAGRYLYAAGRPYHQCQNCLMLRADDSREGWSDLLQRSSMALMTGAGIGIEYSQIREEGAPIRGTGGVATGPVSLMQMVNECARHIVQGGSRRSAIWAGLNWDHPDIHKFIQIKNWNPEVREFKAKDFNFPAPLDMTNISVGLNDSFFEAYHDKTNPKHVHAHSVYWAAMERMLKTGEPGFSVNHGKDDLRNACCEVSSADDSDICNLGSINMSKIDSLEDMAHTTELATMFLLAGTVYSHVPYSKVDLVRSKNRRLGIGLMGVHEWLIKRGKPYGSDSELERYLEVYTQTTEFAKRYAKQWKLSVPKATRAIAPNGTIGILAETTTGIEPIFCTAYKRRYLKYRTWNYQYVVDPTARRLIESGIKPEAIEDAYVLAEDVERRIMFQAWIQKFVDHAISSTINLPPWGSEQNNEHKVHEFGEILLKHLPNLRGVTAYPDGARDGQPLTPVTYSTAMENLGVEVVEEQADVCSIAHGESCGD